MRTADLYDFIDGADLDQNDKPVLLPIQVEGLERGRCAYSDGVRRAIFQAPCGYGKTWIAAEQTRRAIEMGKQILHIVHRRRLVDQMIWTLQKFGMNASPIMEGRQQWHSSVCCASRDTLLAMLKNGVAMPSADLLIWDECHTAANEVSAWYLKNHPLAYWTGYTATPVKANGDSMAPPYQRLVCLAPASKMLELGRLCKVKVYNPDAVGQRRRKGDKVKPVGDPVDHWKKYAKGLPTVAYAANVSESRKLVEKYLAAGIAAEHMDASTPEEEREAIFERSRLGITLVISNCGVLVEGIDLPWLVCCQILRGCNSLILWIQATGRVMRTFKGKEFGIILDHSGAAHEFGMPDSDFKWSLEDAAHNEKANKPPKDRRPISCPVCGAVFVSKSACPECGKVLPKKMRKSLVENAANGDGVLTEFSGQQNGHMESDKLARIFRSCFHKGRAMGKTMGVVAAMFSKEAKMPPWEAGLPFKLPRGKVEWRTPAKEWTI